ncbi:MAG TPA: hypothetical protein VHM48_07710, partial [Candidatus Limnocylindrales bacterium]|nr:hypothetical protein [Candidatus Limnocylindrales bacterium]
MSTDRSPHEPGTRPSGSAISWRLISAVAAVLLAFVACAPARPTPRDSANGSDVAHASEPAPTGRGRPVESDELGWVKLDGVDLRGAFVASGAASSSTTVLLGADSATGALASWTTHDGAAWERHWLDGSTFGGGIPQVVVAGGPGFIALGWDIEPDPADRSTIWTSVDGIDWQQDPDASGRFEGGYVGYATVGSTVIVATCCAAGAPSFHVSDDGLAWAVAAVPAGPLDGPMHLAANSLE